MLRILFGSALFILLVLSACGPSTPSIPVCEACTDLIRIDVADAQNDAVDNFIIEVSFNGEAPGTPVACEPDRRNGASCSFGFFAGVYDIVVQAPGFLPLEKRIRVPGEAGNVCASSCLSEVFVPIVLNRSQP